MRFGIFISLCIFSFGCDQKAKILTIAAASSTQFAMKEIIQSFTIESGVECQMILGSSGKLTAQISKGAPFDLFISADMKYPMDLYLSDLTVNEPQIYAYGELVLWSQTEGLSPTIEILTDDAISHIALANPKTAPYGRAAVEVLKHYKIYESIKNKLIYGESISQTNQFINSGAAQIGFTAKSVISASEMEGKGSQMELDKVYSPISQGIVILNNRNEKYDEAQLFYDFIFSLKGQEILIKFGYSIPE